MRAFTYATVCSGVECCSLALNAAPPTKGAWRPIFFSEIAPFQSALLAHHYPQVPNLGDMTKITAKESVITNGTVAIELPGRLDLLAGGTPCQDFSTSGKRAGAAQGSGTRSSLCWEYLRLASELRPRVILWENVIGCLSTNRGGDFSRLVAEIAHLGYGCAWRVLDSQYTRVDCWPMAIPQRRRRVWFVGVADGDAAGAGKILFEPAGVLGNTPPRRAARKGTTASATPSVGGAYPTIVARMQRLSNQGVEGGELILERDMYSDKVCPTIRTNFDVMPNSCVPIDGRINAAPTVTATSWAIPNTCAAVEGRIILEPDHATLHDTARCLQGNHDSRASDSANVVITQDAHIAFRASTGPAMNLAIGNNISPTLTCGTTMEVCNQHRARRIMPIECERLMGYPDNYTRIPYRGKPAEQCPDGPRYEACGNGWAINCARWILLGIHRYLTEKEETL